VEWKEISLAPAGKRMKEAGRELIIDPETKAKLLAVAKTTNERRRHLDSGRGDASRGGISHSD
jgi:hypothetical protein